MASLYNELNRTKVKGVPEKLKQVTEDLVMTEKFISNYVQFIEAGNWSETITLRLKEAETKLKDLQARKEMLERRSQQTTYFTAAFIKDRLGSLDQLLQGRRIFEVNASIRQLFPHGIKLVRTEDSNSD